MAIHETKPFVKIDRTQKRPGKDFSPRAETLEPAEVPVPKGLSAPQPVIESQSNSKSLETTTVQPEPSSGAESPEAPVSPDASSDAKLSTETKTEKSGAGQQRAVTRPSRKP